MGIWENPSLITPERDSEEDVLSGTFLETGCSLIQKEPENKNEPIA